MREWRESRREGQGEKKEIQRHRAKRNIKRGDSVNGRKGVMNGAGNKLRPTNVALTCDLYLDNDI